MKDCNITQVVKTVTKEEVTSALGEGVTEEIINFWNTYKSILFDSGLNIYGFETAVECHTTYEVAEYVPNYYIIGIDGGGQGIFLKRGDHNHIVYYLGLGALGSLPFNSLDISFFEWIENDPILEGEEEEEFTYVDIIVTKRPIELAKFIFDLKKEFDLSISLGEMKKQIEKEYFIIRQNLIEGSYQDLVSRLNQKYGNCISYKISKV